MPRFDRTGPMGYGPTTGRRLGYCHVPYGTGLREPGLTWRHGWRVRFGGYVRGFGRCYPAYAEGLSADEETSMLQEYIDRLKEELGAVQERLDAISEAGE